MSAISGYVERVWAEDITPALQRYITIPNVSVSYDADWEAHGYPLEYGGGAGDVGDVDIVSTVD